MLGGEPRGHGWLAGYSEELELPFGIDRNLSREFKGVSEFLAAMNHGYMADMTAL
jgi:hypothetical protein